MPQLFNVLAGQMSLVRPRPRPAGTETLGASEVLNLRTVKPGVVGPWTINAIWLSHDEQRDELYYVRNWTVWLDVQVMFQTLMRRLEQRRQG